MNFGSFDSLKVRPMRRQPVIAPDALHGHAQANRLRHHEAVQWVASMGGGFG